MSESHQSKAQLQRRDILGHWCVRRTFGGGANGKNVKDHCRIVIGLNRIRLAVSRCNQQPTLFCDELCVWKSGRQTQCAQTLHRCYNVWNLELVLVANAFVFKLKMASFIDGSSSRWCIVLKITRAVVIVGPRPQALQQFMFNGVL